MGNNIVHASTFFFGIAAAVVVVVVVYDGGARKQATINLAWIHSIGDLGIYNSELCPMGKGQASHTLKTWFFSI